MGIAFLLGGRPAAEVAIHLIMPVTEICNFGGIKGREREEKSVPVIAVNLMRRKNFEHRFNLSKRLIARVGTQCLHDTAPVRRPDRLSIRAANARVQLL